MGISANKIIYDVERKVNLSNSSRSKKIRVVDLVSYVNEAYEIWFENKMRVREQNPRIKNDLRCFIEAKFNINCVEVDCDCCEIVYPENFYELDNAIVKACGKECCEGLNKDIIIKPIEGDDLQEARRNPKRKSSFEWERAISRISQKGFLLYHDGAFEAKSVCIDYYRRPKKIEAANLVECEDHTYVNYDRELIVGNVDLEVDKTYANNEITDLAALLILRDHNQTQGFQTQLQKMLQVQTLYK